jgi:hypothetical protein
MPVAEQFPDDGGSDEAGRASHEYAHVEQSFDLRGIRLRVDAG